MVYRSFQTKLININELAGGLLFFTAGIVLLRNRCLLTFCIVYSVCIVCLPFVLFSLFTYILYNVCLLFILFVYSGFKFVYLNCDFYAFDFMYITLGLVRRLLVIVSKVLVLKLLI